MNKKSRMSRGRRTRRSIARGTREERGTDGSKQQFIDLQTAGSTVSRLVFRKPRSTNLRHGPQPTPRRECALGMDAVPPRVRMCNRIAPRGAHAADHDSTRRQSRDGPRADRHTAGGPAHAGDWPVRRGSPPDALPLRRRPRLLGHDAHPRRHSRQRAHRRRRLPRAGRAAYRIPRPLGRAVGRDPPRGQPRRLGPKAAYQRQPG